MTTVQPRCDPLGGAQIVVHRELARMAVQLSLRRLFMRRLILAF